MPQEEDSDNPVMDGELYGPHIASHPQHKLRFYSKAPEINYECHGCKMPGDSNPFLKCPHVNCNIYLHYLCYILDPDKPGFPHKYFPHCTFKFYNDNSSNVSSGDFPYCDACGEDVKGFRYRCNPFADRPHDNHDVHPTCLRSKLKMDLNEKVQIELKDEVKSKCLECGKRYPAQECISFTGWKWVSKKRVYWGFPHCFTGTKFCVHLKCKNASPNVAAKLKNGPSSKD